jgi:Histidine kinase-, DNA gyrase B-, and HSP90-like ATPase
VTAVQGSREPQAPTGDTPPAAHRAAARPPAGERSISRKNLTALAAVPAAGTALVGALAAAVLAYHARAVHPMRGLTLIAVLVLGALLLCVLLAAVVWAGAVARTAYAAFAAARVPVVVQAAPAAPAGLPPVPSAQGGVGDGAVFVHLSQRLQSLVHRQIELLDALENDVEEPDLLKGLFNVDHLATRMRRHAENLAVLGGAVPRRQWTRPISVMEVLRSAVSETLDYARVQVIARAPGFVNGHAVADIVHLLAELVENATSFSPPDTKVVLRTYPVAAGLAVEIDDRGLGMDRQEYDRLNVLLREPVGVSVQELLEGARIGLYVVAQLARRHGIAVQLQSNITGGTQALVVLPKALLTEVKPRTPEQPQQVRQDPAPAPQQVRPAAPAESEPPAPAPAANPRMYGDATLPAQRRPASQETDGASSAAASEDRPQLPRRRPQEHLAAPLLDVGGGTAARVGEEPSPTLMADFRGGLARGAAAPAAAARPNDPRYDQEGER